ncbi:MAG TPA: methyltransferase domain-containing protein [Planctomycetes bacterium]|nr:methyltransferase domain-containing protein [Planctomycetota bacterium]
MSLRHAAFGPLLALCLFSVSACRSNRAAEPMPESVAPGINDVFLSDDLDVEAFVDRFEGESREVAREHQGIVATLDLEPGMRVADVGAGTGLFLGALADAVGRDGVVFEVDISPRFIEHLNERIETEGYPQAKTVLTGLDRLDLPAESIDVAFVCDTYHHFEFPDRNLDSIRRALRPGGLLVVVDFERIEGVTREWLLSHVRAGKDVVRSEIEAAGFEFVDEPKVEGLKENYVLRFRRP